MSEEFLPHIFEEFSREHNTTDEKVKGTGLGMPIVKRPVDMLTNAPAGHYDLILTDIRMPNMNGYGATRTIRRMDDREKSTIGIIAMTAKAFEEDRRKAVKAGMPG